MSVERKRSPPRPLQPGTDVDAHAKLDVLCNACSQIYGHLDHLKHIWEQNGAKTRSDYMIYHHESANALILSAQEKCHLCTLIVEVLDLAIIENMQETERRAGSIGRGISTRREPSYKLELSASLPPRQSRGTTLHESVACVRGGTYNKTKWSLEVKLPRLQDHMTGEPGTAYSSPIPKAILKIEHRNGSSLLITQERLPSLGFAESYNRIRTLSSSRFFYVDRVLICFCHGSAVAR